MIRFVFGLSVCVGLMGCELEDTGGTSTVSAPVQQSVKKSENGCLVDSYNGTIIPIVDERGRPVCS